MKHTLTFGIALLLAQLVALQAADVNQAGVPVSRPNIIVILHADPDEWQNLAADPGHADRVKEMRTSVEQAWKGDVVTDAPPAKAKAK